VHACHPRPARYMRAESPTRMRYAVGPLAALPMSDFGGGVPRATVPLPVPHNECQLVPTCNTTYLHE
jgi:hypothetical protein